ncbi:MAG: cell envelope integrity protein TolA [Legionellales bacterium]
MTIAPSYRKAFYVAISLHLCIVVLLITESSSKRPVMTMEAKNSQTFEELAPSTPPVEVVKAVSVDSKEIMATVSRLKQERDQQQKAEVSRQKELNRQVEVATQQRIKEQQQITHLKEEANKIAVARKLQAEEEKKHLKALAEQKIVESKRIKELQEQKEKLVQEQKLEKQKLAELSKKKTEEKKKADTLKMEQAKAKAEKAHADKARAEQAKAETAKKTQRDAAAAAQRAAQGAANQARIAGEVDKYKALIVNAIGRNWILPENADSSLSSQFRIRLAPDGMVLDVALTRSSGDTLLDRSAQTAIFKASPLPVPTDAETFNLFRDISLTVRPEQIRG